MPSPRSGVRLPSVGSSSRIVRIHVDPNTITSHIADDFIGFGYEKSAVAQSAFFSDKNGEMVRLYDNLSPHGLIRIGGNVSDHTRYDPAGLAAVHAQTEVTVINRSNLDDLGRFAKATGWAVMWGLNLGTGSKFSGPDSIGNLQWITRFANAESGDIRLLTQHYYRGGAGSKSATLDRTRPSRGIVPPYCAPCCPFGSGDWHGPSLPSYRRDRRQARDGAGGRPEAGVVPARYGTAVKDSVTVLPAVGPSGRRKVSVVRPLVASHSALAPDWSPALSAV
jgi:hypothetical protein